MSDKAHIYRHDDEWWAELAIGRYRYRRAGETPSEAYANLKVWIGVPFATVLQAGAHGGEPLI